MLSVPYVGDVSADGRWNPLFTYYAHALPPLNISHPRVACVHRSGFFENELREAAVERRPSRAASQLAEVIRRPRAQPSPYSVTRLRGHRNCGAMHHGMNRLLRPQDPAAHRVIQFLQPTEKTSLRSSFASYLRQRRIVATGNKAPGGPHGATLSSRSYLQTTGPECQRIARLNLGRFLQWTRALLSRRSASYRHYSKKPEEHSGQGMSPITRYRRAPVSTVLPSLELSCRAHAHHHTACTVTDCTGTWRGRRSTNA
ncbi:hypothetical protein C8Q70DRAFT_162165 [Cubamyces menziesii]|nr:hypothetical protein C8Q70DRAFT_162165 [Cubamyces menziesii]